MNRLLFIVFILSNALTAQVTITGKVIAHDNNPLEYAEVILFSETGSPLINQLTNEKGEFSLVSQKGIYTLEIHQYNEVLHFQKIELNSDFDAGTIVVNNTNVLETVVISNRKNIVERKVDRLVFNLENTISPAGGDALEALRITPGVQVRNENITIIGKGSVRVLIDDKMVELGEADLIDLLRSIPADNIKSIEVITTPPAKYDAAGNSGLLNIQLKKAKKDAWNLSLGTGYLRRSEEGENAATSNFMYNKKKFSMSSSLNYRQGGETFDFKDLNYFPEELWNPNQVVTRNYKRINGILSMEYAATSKWSFGLQYLTNFNKTESNRTGITLVNDYTTASILKNVKSDAYADQKPIFNSINIFNEVKLDSVGKKITLNIDYFNYSNNDSRPYDGTMTIYNPYSDQFFKGINTNDQKTNNFSGKVDFEFPTELFNWSFGGKLSALNTKNHIYAFNSGLVDAPVTDMPQKTNTSEYDENIQALYFSGNKKFTNKIELQIGLRLETTQTKSYNEILSEAVSNNYSKLFPSVNISYSGKENSTYRFSYSKRIGRPNFAELNPNVTYLSPFLTVEGNPFLKPYFIDNFELIYSYKKLESKIYYSIENNMYNQIGLPDSGNYLIRLTNRNMFNIKRYGISEVYIFDKFSWWTSYTNFVLNYLTSETVNIPAKGVDGFYSSISTNNDFVLNKDKTILFNFNFQCMPVGTYGVNRLDLSSSTSLSLQYLLLNKDLRITLKANDIFKTDIMKFNSTVDGIHRDSNYYFDTRFVQFSVNYKFGNKKVNVGKRETGNADERTRTGN